MKMYKVLRFFVNIFAAFFLIGTIFYIAMSNSVESVEKNAVAIAGVVFIVLFVLCVIVSKKLKKKIRRPIEEAKQKAIEVAQRKLAEHQEFMRQIGASFERNGLHTYGLPVAEDVKVTCYWCKDKVLFETSGASFNLSFDKLTDVVSKTEQEIQTATSNQQQYVSSLGRAATGAVMFGPLGAVIGGRARKKNVTTTTTISSQISYYLIFTYVDNDEVKYIAIEMTSIDMTLPFIEAFKQIKPTTTQSFDL